MHVHFLLIILIIAVKTGLKHLAVKTTILIFFDNFAHNLKLFTVFLFLPLVPSYYSKFHRKICSYDSVGHFLCIHDFIMNHYYNTCDFYAINLEKMSIFDIFS